MKRQLGYHVTLIVAITVTVLYTGQPSSDQQSTQAHMRPAPSSQLNFPPPPKKDKLSKLDPALQQLWQASTLPTELGPLSIAMQSVHVANGLVQAIIEVVPGGEDLIAAVVESAGGRVERLMPGLVQALLPVLSLPGISEHPLVSFVRRPYYPWPSTTVTEGLMSIGVQAWHNAGVRGRGVKIGIIDTGFYGYQSLLGQELPADNRVVYRSFSSLPCNLPTSCKHGTAIAEIIHDIAPEATLYLAQISTEIEIADAVSWFAREGVHIVNVSLGSPAWGPGDGTGFVSQVVSLAHGSGILWVNAAGNFGQGHWSGMWSDLDRDRWHDFGTGTEINFLTISGMRLIPAGTVISIYLKWQDTWSSSCNDYDLYLWYVDPFLGPILGPILVAKSDGPQACGPGQRPVEAIHYVTVYSGYYAVSIGAGEILPPSPRKLELFVKDLSWEANVPAMSIVPPADSPLALAVGAVPWSRPSEIEPFSSQGPTLDGRIKPDLVAPDGVSTAAYGATAFPGTSASAPHVAGAAALVKQADPSLGPAQIRAFLEARAVDLGVPGKDNIFGAGRLSLGQPFSGAAPPSSSPTPTPSPTTPPAARPAAPGLVSIQPYDYQRARVTWVPPEGVSYYRVCVDFFFNFTSSFASCYDIPASDAPGEALVGVPWWDLGVLYYRLQACNQLGCSIPVTAGAVARRIWPGENDWNFYMTATLDSFGFIKIAAMNSSPVPGKRSDLQVWDGLAGWGGVIHSTCRGIAPGEICGPYSFRSGSSFVSASQAFPPYGSIAVGVQVR